MKRKADVIEFAVFTLIRILTFGVIFALVFMLAFIVKNGISAITLDFFIKMPENQMRGGGIMPAIVGTVLLMAGSALVSIPVGIATAVYLNEYARSPRVVKIIRICINNLAGVPSVVFGLFGLSLFVIFLDFGTSILAGSLTLGVLSLPVIIRSTEEALQTVPSTYREASLSLGASRWQTISKIILPNALPGILTGVMLSLGRSAGETAPIMFTAAAFFAPDLPRSVYSEVMALPYHIYVLATAGLHIQQTRHLQYGTAIVLILLVLLLNSSALIMRYRFKNRLKR